MDFIKSAAVTTGIGVLGLGAYAIASPLMIPVGVAMVLGGGLSWLYQRAHCEGENIS
jgi:hypothetical protein